MTTDPKPTTAFDLDAVVNSIRYGVAALELIQDGVHDKQVKHGLFFLWRHLNEDVKTLRKMVDAMCSTNAASKPSVADGKAD